MPQAFLADSITVSRLRPSRNHKPNKPLALETDCSCSSLSVFSHPQTSETVYIPWSSMASRISIKRCRHQQEIEQVFLPTSSVWSTLPIWWLNKILFLWMKILTTSAVPVGCLWLKTAFHYLSWFASQEFKQNLVGNFSTYCANDWLAVAHYFHLMAVLMWMTQGSVQMPNTLARMPGKLGSAKKKILSPGRLRANLHIFACLFSPQERWSSYIKAIFVYIVDSFLTQKLFWTLKFQTFGNSKIIFC